MTDYNDGNWHGWNGGECPVHPESEIDVAMVHGVYKGRMAGFFTWGEDADGTIIAFRVTKPYVEPKKPREWWIVMYDGTAWDSPSIADKYMDKIDQLDSQLIHVREVLEEL